MPQKKLIPTHYRTGIALPIIRVNGEDYDISRLDRDELSDLRILVESAMADVDTKIESAATAYNTTGEQSDPKWFNAARGARRVLGIQVQAIMAEQTKRKRDGANLQHHFFNAARDMLSRDVFGMIVDEAERRRDVK